MFNLKIQKSGDLLLTADNDGRKWLSEKMPEQCDLALLPQILEPFSTNGSFTFFDAGQGNPFVGLTETPCIAESIDYDDIGNAQIIGNFWFFGAYMLRDCCEDLKNSGRVVFQLARG